MELADKVWKENLEFLVGVMNQIWKGDLIDIFKWEDFIDISRDINVRENLVVLVVGILFWEKNSRRFSEEIFL